MECAERVPYASRERHKTEGLGDIEEKKAATVKSWLIRNQGILSSKGCKVMIHRAEYKKLRSCAILNGRQGPKPVYPRRGILEVEGLLGDDTPSKPSCATLLNVRHPNRLIQDQKTLGS